MVLYRIESAQNYDYIYVYISTLYIALMYIRILVHWKISIWSISIQLLVFFTAISLCVHIRLQNNQNYEPNL